MVHSPHEQWLDRAGLASLQQRKLSRLLAEAGASNRFWQRKLHAVTWPGGAPGEGMSDFGDFPRIPFTTKDEISADQQAHPPYGTNLTYPLDRYTRMHQTSGTTGAGMRWLDTRESWSWILDCWQTIYDAVELRPEDRLFFAFSFGPFLGFWTAFEGAQRRGNFCLSGGGMSSAARLRAIVEHRITVLCCTPTYAVHLAEIAAQENLDLAGSAVRMVLVAGEPGGSIPGTRERIERSFGARVFDHTGMTEIGALGIECVHRPAEVHLIESECIAELVDPASGKLLFSPAGDARELPAPTEGELVLTNLGRLGSPLIRYRTGDIVRLHTGRCACGREFVRMVGGIIGRADDMIFVRGNNVYPSAIDSVIRQFPDIAEYQVIVGEAAGLTTVEIHIEPTAPAARQGSSVAADAAVLGRRVGEAIEQRLFFRAEVKVVPPGTLPRYELKARRVIRKAH